MSQNPIAKAVTRIRPQVVPDKRRKLARDAERNDDAITHTTNATRADRAENVVFTYIVGKGEVFENCLDEVTDLVADLLHLAARMARDDAAEAEDYVERVIRLARMHFDAEHGNPEEAAEQTRAP